MMVHRTMIAWVVLASLLVAGCGGGSGGGTSTPTDFDPNNRDRAAIWWGGLVRQLADAKASGNEVRVEEAMQMLDSARVPLVGQRVRFRFNVWATNPDLPETVWDYKRISSAGVWVGLLHRSDPGRIRVGVKHPERQGARAFLLKAGQDIDPALLRDLTDRSSFEVSGTITRTAIDRLDTWHQGFKRFTDPPTLAIFIKDIAVEKVNP